MHTEGAPTVAIVPVVYFFPMDSPNNATFLRQDERTLERMKTCDTTAKSKLNKAQIFAGLNDYKNWCHAFLHFCCNYSFAALSNSLSTIVHNVSLLPSSPCYCWLPVVTAFRSRVHHPGPSVSSLSRTSMLISRNIRWVTARLMGYSSIDAQGLTAPPYLRALITSIVAAYVTDRWGSRGWILSSCGTDGCIGYALLPSQTVTGVRYLGVWLASCGVFPSLAINMMWMLNNNAGERRRVSECPCWPSSASVLPSWLPRSPQTRMRKSLSTLITELY